MRLRALACEAEGAVSGDSQARCLHVSEVETLFGISRSFEVRGESPRGSLDTVTCASEPRGFMSACDGRRGRMPRPNGAGTNAGGRNGRARGARGRRIFSAKPAFSTLCDSDTLIPVCAECRRLACRCQILLLAQLSVHRATD